MFGGGFWIAGWAMKCGMGFGRLGVDWGVKCKRVEAGRRLVAGRSSEFAEEEGGGMLGSLVLSSTLWKKGVEGEGEGIGFNWGRALEWRI